jgi:hypothetical protein
LNLTCIRLLFTTNSSFILTFKTGEGGLLKGQCHEIFDFRFLHGTGGKFTVGVVDTGDKIATCVKNTILVAHLDF